LSSQVILAIGLVLSLAGTLGVAFAVFKSATVTKTIELLETENTALSKSVTRQQADLTLLQDRVGQLEQANNVLKNIVTGRSEIEALSAHVKAEEQSRREEHQTMLVLLKDLIAQFRNARGEIGK
jgi:hypothetical protein